MNKTAIGAFVLGAIALLVIGVLVLGAGKLFTTEHTFVTYFDGSVKGLNVGSPVTFRGVKVGEVTDISIMADPVARKLKIPVLFKLEPAKFKGTRTEFQREPQAIEKAVKELGLRTQLQTQSFVTGQLMVSLDFFPDKPAQFVGLTKEYPEVPSVPTSLEQLQKTLENLPLKEIVTNLNETLKGVENLVNSIDAKKTTQTIESAIREVQTLVAHVNEKVGPLAESVTKTSTAAEEALVKTSTAAESALAETEKTMASLRVDIKQTLDHAEKTLETARSAMKQSEQTLQAYSDDSRLVTEMNKTLRELSATSRSFRNLSDYLERHPESLIRGKAGAKGD
ncbi:MAG TPA: MlaD family protein [Geobacteraceae bacterium]